MKSGKRFIVEKKLNSTALLEDAKYYHLFN